MKIVANGYDAYIIVIHPQRVEKGFVGAVADLGVGDEGQNLLHQLLVLIHRHHLMVQLIQLLGDVLAEAAQTDE